MPGLRRLAIRGLVVLPWTGAPCSCWARCCPDFDVHGAGRGVRDGGHRRRAQRARVAHAQPPGAAAQRAHAGRRGARAQRRARGASRRAISPGASINGWFAGVVVAVGMTVITTAASALLAIDDDETWQRNVVRRQARRAGAIASDVPGVVFLEIDGLAHEVLRRALRDGNAPVHGALAARGHPPARALGDRLVLADRRLPGGPAARRQRRHAGLPLVGEGSRPRDRDQPPARRRRSSSAATPTAAGCCTRTAPAARTSSRATRRTRC